MTWQDTLDSLTRPNSPAYLEAEVWKRDGWTLERVIAEWPVGADILWIAEIMGIITREEASRVACACVDAVADLAPDVDAVVGAVWQGDMVGAWHEAIEVEDATPGAGKARFAAARLLSGDNPNAMYHAAQARVHDARNAWAQAIRDGASKAEIAELEASIKRVEDAANRAQADFVRWALRGAE